MRLPSRYALNIASTSSGADSNEANRPVPKRNRMPAIIAAAIAAGIWRMMRSNVPDSPTSRITSAVAR